MADWASKIYTRINDNYEMMYPYNLKMRSDNIDMSNERLNLNKKEKKV